MSEELDPHDHQAAHHDSLPGFPKPSRQHSEGDPAWKMRAKLSVAFGMCAVVALFVSLTRAWWEIHYDEHALCEQNKDFCGLHVRMALTSFCFGTPTHYECDDLDHLEHRFNGDLQVQHLASIAHFLLVLAILMHMPLFVILIVLLGFNRCGSNRAARHCGLRSATCLAGLAAGFGAAVAGIFIGALLPRYMEFTWHLVGQAFGRMAMGSTKLQDNIHMSPVACAVAVAFDLSVACLTFHGQLFPHLKLGRAPVPTRQEAMQMIPYGGPPILPAFYTAVPQEDMSDEEIAMFDAASPLPEPTASTPAMSPSAEFQPLAMSSASAAAVDPVAFAAALEAQRSAEREFNPGRKLQKAVGRYRQYQIPSQRPQPMSVAWN